VAAFVEELTAAVSEDMASFRESEMPSPPGDAVLVRPIGQVEHAGLIEALMDKMGRLYVPPAAIWGQVSYVLVSPLAEPMNEEAYYIVRREDRYEGNTVSHFVLYLTRGDNAKEDDS
jgi:hypothetical protein